MVRQQRPPRANLLARIEDAAVQGCIFGGDPDRQDQRIEDRENERVLPAFVRVVVMLPGA
jgi:hypothetical protein